ncbi:C-type lectin domain family 2 member B-like [Notechis scutatus]|uniref:C-type lectin domain family 2 member B-like n=1 Tax=Notechis scutatus TaxID=8663 RepID=A0A6J1VUB9_9SAUR|nr:C-type lectin domain family 2 member B-like [Notechis scutatus]
MVTGNHTNPGIMNMDEEKKLQSSLSNGSAGEQEEDAAHGEPVSRCFSRLPFPSYLLIGIVIISYLIFGGFFFGMGILYHQRNAIKCIPVTCPPGWIGYERRCYKFSEEEKTQNESQNICTLHNAFLANITKEMDFVKKFTRDHVFWIGLKREPNQPWKWLDGENSTLEVMGNGGNCAYLNDDGTAGSGTCSNTHRYICKKNMIL